MNARSKGQRGEKMGVEFMKTWTGMDFRRTPGSGGLRGHVVEYSVGDIVLVTPNRILPFVVEIKFYKDLNFQHLLYNVDSEILKFWGQVNADCVRGLKLPLLLLRYNGLPRDLFFVVIDLETAKIIFPKRPRHSFIFRKTLITTTHQLIKRPYKDLEKPLLKLVKKRWS